MKVYLTVSVDHLAINRNELMGFKVFSFGDVYVKYEISITDKNKYASRQKYLAEEVSLLNENIIIIGNRCYDLNDILVLINELNKYNKLITSIYIPSEIIIEQRKKKAYKERQRWGNREGISNEEIERNFENFRSTLQEIKGGLKDTLIKVKEV
jgi:hypothetical protein